MALTPGTRLGVYDITAPIGEGGMGQVYRATDTTLGRQVAIKILPDAFAADPDRLARLEREAKTLASLNHPHIAAIYGFEQSAGLHALVMELVEGDDLSQRIARGAIPIDEALPIAKQIAEALEAAHEQGIIHRDLKPANIKVRADGTVKVLDFGLAKAMDVGSGGPGGLSMSPTITAHHTRAGVILGTAAYMSPEQARGRPVDKRTDIWAFGCVLYEMLTGRGAFGGETVSDIIAAVLGPVPEWSALPAGTPASVRRLLPRLLEKDVKRRVRDIGDVRIELEDAPANTETAVVEPPPSVRPWRTVGVASLVTLIATVAMTMATMRLLGRRDTAAIPRGELAIVSQLTSYDGTEAHGALAPDGKSFAFVSDMGGTPDIWIRQIAGGDPVRVTNDDAVESQLVHASDAESIYFARAGGGERAIWRIGTFGGQARKVITDADSPSPSPDGRSLAWYAARPGEGTSLVVGAADGSGPRVLATHLAAQSAGGQVSRPVWSRDGRTIAYSSGGLAEPRNLFAIDVASGRARQVTRFTGGVDGIHTQAWLPDNRHLIVSYAPRTGGTGALGVLDVETGSMARLTMNVKEGFNGPSVSADGSRIIVSAGNGERELWRVPFGPDPIANGRAAVRVMDALQDPFYTYVTRDARTLLFSNALVGSRNLWTVPLDAVGAKPHQVTSAPVDARITHASLSPDATRVAFIGMMTGNADVWVQNVDGSGLRQLSNNAEGEHWPIWSPDGKWIAYGAASGLRRVPADGGPAEKIFEGSSRGDWIRKPDGSGTWITSAAGGGIRLLDVEQRRLVWQDRRPCVMPMFSSDAKLVSVACDDGRDRDAIWVYDTATGTSRVAVRFSEPFRMSFRVSWVDNDRAFLVNRVRTISHIVMLDKFWERGSDAPR